MGLGVHLREDAPDAACGTSGGRTHGRARCGAPGRATGRGPPRGRPCRGRWRRRGRRTPARARRGGRGRSTRRECAWRPGSSRWLRFSRRPGYGARVSVGNRTRAPVRDLRQRGAGRVSDGSGRARRARGGGAQDDVAGGIRLRGRWRRHRGDDAREPRGVRALADRPSDAPGRVDARHRGRGARYAPAEPVRAVPDRRARDGAPRRGRRGGSRRRERGHPLRLLEPGLPPDGGGRERDGRRPPLVPALLEHVERARREPRLAGRALRLQRDRPHPRHDDARLADPRPRPRVPAVPPREGHRPVHERPGLPRGAPGDAPPGGAPDRAHHPRGDRDAPEPGERLSRARALRRSARASRARPSVASSRRTRVRRCRGTTSPSSASGRGCRSC